ncbi:MAG: S8 family serine peptidase [Phycisphaerales bacterium]|nr:S8 family serine peptidase [Planctomycetota bacterium]MCH8509265.1 S8 family serine peptidase [Phycisphaerales bacterium]
MLDRMWYAIGVCAGASFAGMPALAQSIDRDLQRLVADAGAAPAGVATPYFDRRVDLGLYPAMIAVFNDPAAGPRANLRGAMDAIGLVGADMESSSVPGWTYVVLPAHARSADAVANAVRDLADRADLDMASPVYLGQDGLPVIPTRDLLISFVPGTPDAERIAVLDAHGATVLERDAAGFDGVVRARTTARTGQAALDIALAIHDHPAVEWAQSDRIFWAKRKSQFPNDPLFGQQWALFQPNGEHMDALTAWTVTIGDPTIRVIVLDSGIQQNHPDLTQLPGQSFTGSGNGGPANACDNHGTAVAGCVAATIDNGIGIAGIAPGVHVQSGKIFNEISLFGFCLPFLESQDSWSAAGINWATTSGAQVTNSSWGGGGDSQAITSAFNNGRAQGVIHFAASGNDGGTTIGYPANLGSVNAVGALNSAGNRASFSTSGSGLFISAPGAAILTTDRTGSSGYSNGDYTTIDGTSFASPYAAGVAALLLSVNPTLTPAQVEDILASTAVDKGTPGYNTQYGWGFINAGAAVLSAAGSPCPADLNGDGLLNFFDVAAYLDLYVAGDPAADLTGDGNLNFFDVAAYMDLYNAGCP